MEGLLGPDHLARFIWHILSALDFSDLEGRFRSIQGGPGRPPYHPRLLVALWVYGMTQGLETATAIAQACRIRDDFRWLAGGLCPSDQTLLNLLAMAPAALCSIWGQVLRALHGAGHIDLSALIEDGTKLRANASPRSFHPATEITDIVKDLERRLAAKLQALGASAVSPGTPSGSRSMAAVRGLTGQLARAQQAIAELEQRRGPAPAPVTTPPKFGREDFPHDAERDLLVCPAGESLRFVGVYGASEGSAYRLYKARMTACRTCRLKAQCTAAPRRSVKVPVDTPTPPAGPSSALSDPPPAPKAPSTGPALLATQADSPPSGPRASITEPEALMMLATSVKRWEPSYNADLTVTRHGLIVNQFLTKAPTDYHHFRRALPAVLTTLGRPEAWVGDGHYSTQENVLLAHRAGVVLYAPLPDSEANDAPAPPSAGTPSVAEATVTAPGPARKFCRRDFRHDSETDTLICPAGQELRLVGIYRDEYRAPYRVYGRSQSQCAPCALKARCTDGRGRRVKLPATTGADPDRSPPAPTAEPNTTPSAGTPIPSPTAPGEVTQLVEALGARMRELGDRIRTFRSMTIEPVNAQLKQHGLGRLHVHGLARCATVLTLACIAHNLMKWKAREVARALKIPA